MRFFLILALVSALAFSSLADTGITLRSVNRHKKYDFGIQYVAIVYEMTVPTGNYYITGVNATNVQGLGNNNVQGLHIVHQDVHFMPGRILDFFPNINHYHVVGSGLESVGNAPLDGRIKYIHFDDNRIRTIPKSFFGSSGEMQLISFERNFIETLDGGLFGGMPNLKWVSFAGNRIRSLPGTLFASNLNLECISFENNGLTRVGVDLVKGLTKLKGVSFDGNVCINSAYWDQSNIGEELTNDIKSFCDGRCESTNEIQQNVEKMMDSLWQLEEKYPQCSLWVGFWMKKWSEQKQRQTTASDSAESGEIQNKMRRFRISM